VNENKALGLLKYDPNRSTHFSDERGHELNGTLDILKAIARLIPNLKSMLNCSLETSPDGCMSRFEKHVLDLEIGEELSPEPSWRKCSPSMARKVARRSSPQSAWGVGVF
jgi:hypothetical protein